VSCPHTHFYQGTPISIARAVERGGPVPLKKKEFLSLFPKVPESPECYASIHLDRIKKFRVQSKELLVYPPKLTIDDNQAQGDRWRHELEHDAESVCLLAPLLGYDRAA
jgi:hypothetical protein